MLFLQTPYNQVNSFKILSVFLLWEDLYLPQIVEM